MDDVREERHEDAVAPGRRRPDRDERVHRRPAVPSRPPGRRVEAPPAQNWMIVAGTRTIRLMSSIGTTVWGQNIATMIASGDTDRDDGLAEDLLGVSRAPGGVGVGGLAERPRRRRFGVRRRLERVPRGLDRGFQLRPARDLRQVADRRRLRREVDDGVGDAGRLLQEAFDAVDAARAGHALDREGDLDRGRGGRGRRCRHTPGEYSREDTIP